MCPVAWGATAKQPHIHTGTHAVERYIGRFPLFVLLLLLLLLLLPYTCMPDPAMLLEHMQAQVGPQARRVPSCVMGPCFPVASVEATPAHSGSTKVDIDLRGWAHILGNVVAPEPLQTEH